MKNNSPNLELLPPNTKHECPTCKKSYRKLWKCKDGIKRCKMCKKNQITNKFYIPLIERKNLTGSIGKFSMTSTEKNQLHKQFMNEGLDSEQAWIKVSQHIRLLKMQKQKNRWSDYDIRAERILKIIQKRPFIKNVKSGSGKSKTYWFVFMKIPK